MIYYCTKSGKPVSECQCEWCAGDIGYTVSDEAHKINIELSREARRLLSYMGIKIPRVYKDECRDIGSYTVVAGKLQEDWVPMVGKFYKLHDNWQN